MYSVIFTSNVLGCRDCKQNERDKHMIIVYRSLS